MKKLIILGCALLSVHLISAQWFGQNNIKGNGNIVQENRSTKAYDEIDMAGFFDVELIAGTEGSIVIKGEENLIPHIITEVRGTKLVLSTEEGYNLQPSKRNGIVVIVPFEQIEGVNLTGSGDILGKDIIKSTNFMTKLTGSGNINLNIEAETTESVLVGSGDIYLQGSTKKAIHKVTGSGDIEAQSLKATDVEATISGSGDIDLYCDGFLKVRISGSGDVNYFGNPSKEDSKVAGSGDISRG